MPVQSFGTYNGVGVTSLQTMVGSVPIWQNPEDLQKDLGGFTIANAPDAESLIPGGTPIDIDEATRTAGICYRFEVYETAGSSPTTYKVVKNITKYGNLLKVGMNVMIQPATLAGTGAAYPILTIDTSNADYDSFTVGTTLGDVTAGDVLAEANSTHATTAVILYTGDRLTYEDVYVPSDDLQYSVAGVYFGSIYDRRIRKIAAIEKANMPQINFSQSK